MYFFNSFSKLQQKQKQIDSHIILIFYWEEDKNMNWVPISIITY